MVNPLMEALRVEIVKLATEGDGKEGKALTVDVLARIMRVAKTGRDLMVALSVSPENLAGMVKRPNLFSSLSGDGEVDSDGVGNSQMSVGPLGFPFAPSSMGENFGVTVIREIIAAARNLNGTNSPARLVEAIAVAKEHGLTDIATDLEKQLGIKGAAPEPLKAVTFSEPEKKEQAS